MAIRSSNLSYVGEIPFSYISDSDRYVAFSDLLFPALQPGSAATHQGLVRLEDVDPTANPTVLRQFADYRSSQHVPFSVGVIPQYTDPKGSYNGGRPQTVRWPRPLPSYRRSSTCSPRAARSSSTVTPTSTPTSPTPNGVNRNCSSAASSAAVRSTTAGSRPVLPLRGQRRLRGEDHPGGPGQLRTDDREQQPAQDARGHHPQRPGGPGGDPEVASCSSTRPSLTYLQQIVTGIKSLGYTFVAPTGLPG